MFAALVIAITRGTGGDYSINNDNSGSSTTGIAVRV
jgi:hypothetical protein